MGYLPFWLRLYLHFHPQLSDILDKKLTLLTMEKSDLLWNSNKSIIQEKVNSLFKIAVP